MLSRFNSAKTKSLVARAKLKDVKCAKSAVLSAAQISRMTDEYGTLQDTSRSIESNCLCLRSREFQKAALREKTMRNASESICTIG